MLHLRRLVDVGRARWSEESVRFRDEPVLFPLVTEGRSEPRLGTSDARALVGDELRLIAHRRRRASEERVPSSLTSSGRSGARALVGDEPRLVAHRRRRTSEEHVGASVPRSGRSGARAPVGDARFPVVHEPTRAGDGRGRTSVVRLRARNERARTTERHGRRRLVLSRTSEAP